MNTQSSTPCSLRLPQSLRARIRERANLERRSFANTVRVLLERQLDASEHVVDVGTVDPDEIERLADLAREVIAAAQR